MTQQGEEPPKTGEELITQELEAMEQLLSMVVETVE